MKRIGPSVFLCTFIVLVLVQFGLASVGRSALAPSTAYVPVEEFELANGMTVLLVPKADATTVAVGWMVQAGSADDAPDQTGLSHLLEHMMFKGSRTVGTRNLDHELAAIDEVDRLWAERNQLATKLERASPKKQRQLSQQIGQISTEMQTAQTTASSLAFLGHYSFSYSEQGGTDLNANTYRDLSLYQVTLPSEKLEIWFWLESDRLLAPVFREFYKEVQVVHEERRQRIESTPTGLLDEQVRKLFWGDHAYAWNPLGNAADLNRLSRQDALNFFHRHYRPDAMTAVLVGGFDPQQVKAWFDRYFGRLPAPAKPEPGAMSVTPTLRSQEERLVATCNCPPQVQILYPTARFGDPEAVALQLLSAVLNGRTGRLYRSLVLDQRIAFSAYSQQISWRQAGEFSFRAESKGEVDPSELIRAWDQQIELLRTHPPTIDEIHRARNRSTADAFRSLKDPTALMKQLLIYQGLGDWRYINQWSGQIQEITSSDLVEVASKYLLPQRRTVAIYRRPQGKDQQ